jgi:hypothetical protein
MRIVHYIILVFACFIGGRGNALQAQIFTAKGGSFVVFHDTPLKDATVQLSGVSGMREKYEWPKNENEFIQEYRIAENIFAGPMNLTDENLQKMWAQLEDMDALAPSYQFTPTLLLALGQATYIPGNEKLDACTISIRNGKETETKSLQWFDHMAVGGTGKAESVKDNGIQVKLKFIFPKESWIKGARVYKKTVGAEKQTEIFPFVFASSWIDRIEMNIRDTMKLVGEFLYTIQPIDYLGNIHPALQPVYAHNYNNMSAPLIVRFKSEAIKESKVIRLAWQCSVPERVRGFEIYRGMESDGPFQRIASLPPSDSFYIDQVEGVMHNFFYYIQILDQTDKGNKSIIQFVTPILKEKPGPPIDLIATPAKEGVKLTWPTLDGMYQTRGYYVYRLGRDTSSWSQVSEFLPRKGEIMSYTDTSKILQTQNEYTYVVKSESTSYILSEPSTIAVSRPDKPREVETPGDLSWRFMDEGQLMLYWSDQRIHDPYIIRYHIYAADVNGQAEMEVPGSPISSGQNVWLQPDTFLIKDGYAIRSEDAWGNLSPVSQTIHPLSNKIISAPGIILVHPNANGYRLSWGLPTEKTIKSIQLYELNTKEEAVLVKSLTPQTGTFDIPKLKDGQVRSFYLSYKTIDGKESEVGDVVIVSK